MAQRPDNLVRINTMNNRASARRGNGQLISAKNWVITLWDVNSIQSFFNTDINTGERQLRPGIRYLCF